jgi:hypothetical protein
LSRVKRYQHVIRHFVEKALRFAAGHPGVPRSKDAFVSVVAEVMDHPFEATAELIEELGIKVRTEVPC